MPFYNDYEMFANEGKVFREELNDEIAVQEKECVLIYENKMSSEQNEIVQLINADHEELNSPQQVRQHDPRNEIWTDIEEKFAHVKNILDVKTDEMSDMTRNAYLSQLECHKLALMTDYLKFVFSQGDDYREEFLLTKQHFKELEHALNMKSNELDNMEQRDI